LIILTKGFAQFPFASINTVGYLLSFCRQGYRYGHGEVVDGMLKDGLWDVYNDYAMGVCAELCAEQHGISREEQVVHIQEPF
jgi:acetyl-CoA C-acetyltransferase